MDVNDRSGRPFTHNNPPCTDHGTLTQSHGAPLRRLKNQTAVPMSRTIRTIHHQSPASPLKSGGGAVTCENPGVTGRSVEAITHPKKYRICSLLLWMWRSG